MNNGQTNLDNLEKNKKKFSFKLSKFINWVMNRKPHIKFLREEFPKDQPVLFLANHVGKKVPVKIELYWERDFRTPNGNPRLFNCRDENEPWLLRL